MEPAVFLDRDNTLIANDGDLGDPAAVRLLDGVPDGLRALRAAGYRLVVVTNQGGVARGMFTEADVDAVHRRIAAVLESHTGGDRLIDRFYYCPFHPEATIDHYRREHPWRKPGAGMLLQAARDLELDLARSWMIGDQPRDIDAGQAAGTRTILLGATDDDDLRPTATAPDFPAAVQIVLRRTAGPLRGTGGGRARRADGGADEPGLRATAVAVAEPKPARARPAPPPPAPARAESPELLAAVRELTEEIRSQRQRGAEWSALRMLAVVGQLVALLLALLALLHLDALEPYLRWMAGAAIVQLLTMTALVADLKG